MGLRRALRQYKDLIFNEEFSKQVRAADAMKIKVLSLMRAQGISENSYEYAVVKGTPICARSHVGYLVNSLFAHLPENNAMSIIEACRYLEPVAPPSETMISAEQIHILNSLVILHNDFNGATPVQLDQFEKVVQHAMTHVEDWVLLERVISDREIWSLPELISVLTVIKGNATSALSEGAL